MSNWQPVPGKGNELRREMRCHGKPPAVMHVARIGSLDGFDYVAMAASTIGSGTLMTSAKAKSVTEAKVIADALGKYVRHMAMRKERKDARRALRIGSVERELVETEGGEVRVRRSEACSGEALWKMIAATGVSFAAVIIACVDPNALIALVIVAGGLFAMWKGGGE